MNDLLRELGCEEIQKTEARFPDGLDFYLDIAALALSEEAFDKLGATLRSKDASAALETAQSLKDVISNCGITPMLRLIEQMVEPLRNGKPDDSALSVLYDELLAQRDIASSIIAASKGEGQ